MTQAQATDQARRLDEQSECVRWTAQAFGCTLADALAIERIETLLMAEMPERKRRVIEHNLQLAVERAQGNVRRAA